MIDTLLETWPCTITDDGKWMWSTFQMPPDRAAIQNEMDEEVTQESPCDAEIQTNDVFFLS